MPQSRQERRRDERDAAKRAPRAGAAGAAGATGAAAALANLNVSPVDDWTTQTEDPWVLVRALGAEVVKRRAGEGERDAQFSLGYRLLLEEGGSTESAPSAGDRSTKAYVGLALLQFAPHSFRFPDAR